MRQRVVIALALGADPQLVIADEPTTALDVSVQAQIIALIKRLCRERGAAVMLITHDMGVIAETADRVAVMYAGRVAEIGPVRDVVKHPQHPYTQGLMAAIPTLGGRAGRALDADPGRDAAPRRHPAGLRLQSALRPGLRALRRRAPADLRRPGPAGAACFLHDREPRARRRHAVAEALDERDRARGRVASTPARQRTPLVAIEGLWRVFDLSRPWLNRVLEGGGRWC